MSQRLPDLPSLDHLNVSGVVVLAFDLVADAEWTDPASRHSRPYRGGVPTALLTPKKGAWHCARPFGLLIG